MEFLINEESPVVGVPLEKLNLKKNLLIACINHGGKIVIPNGKSQITVGDTVIIVTIHKGLNDIQSILAD